MTPEEIQALDQEWLQFKIQQVQREELQRSAAGRQSELAAQIAAFDALDSESAAEVLAPLSAIVRDFARAHNLPYLDIKSAQVTAEDLSGTPRLSAEEHNAFPKGRWSK